MPSKMTPETFFRIRGELAETLGELQECSYFGVLRRGDLRDHLWKLSFVRDGKARDALFLVRVFREPGAPPRAVGVSLSVYTCPGASSERAAGSERAARAAQQARVVFMADSIPHPLAERAEFRLAGKGWSVIR